MTWKEIRRETGTGIVTILWSENVAIDVELPQGKKTSCSIAMITLLRERMGIRSNGSGTGNLVRGRSFLHVCRCSHRKHAFSVRLSLQRPNSFHPSPQGERRFYLGTMVDDLFLDTNVFEFNGGDSTPVPYDNVYEENNEGEKVSRETLRNPTDDALELDRRRSLFLPAVPPNGVRRPMEFSESRSGKAVASSCVKWRRDTLSLPRKASYPRAGGGGEGALHLSNPLIFFEIRGSFLPDALPKRWTIWNYTTKPKSWVPTHSCRGQAPSIVSSLW